jgi:hypothetical protein
MKKQLIFVGFIAFSVSSHAQGLYSAPAGLSGFNTINPGNRVEINTGGGDPYHGSVFGSSGLRFKNLNSTKVPLNNQFGGVLSVDSNGDVVWVKVSSGGSGNFGGAQNGSSVIGGNIVELGGPLGSASSAMLLNDREIPMGGRKILFSGTGVNSSNQITIGSNPGIPGKFNVVCNEYTSPNPGLSFAASFENYYAGGSAGAAYFASTQNKSLGRNLGIQCTAQNAFINTGLFSGAGPTQPGGVNIGGRFEAIDNTNTASSCIGISAEVRGANNANDNVAVGGSANSPVGRNFGATFYGGSANQQQANWGLQSTTNANGSYNAAGYFQSPNSNNIPANAPLFNAGVHAFAPSPISFGPNWVNSFAGYFDGNVTVNGAGVITNGPWSPSDNRIKKNVQDLKSALDIVQKIKTKTYYYDRSNFKALNIEEDRLQYGVIAQELEKILPELVRETSILTSPVNDKNEKPEVTVLKSVNYLELVPILIAATQEQQVIINKLVEQVEALRNDATQGRKLENSGITPQNLPIEGFQMSQNEPNPFTHETIVKYTLPTTVSNAFMAVYDLTGKQITTFPIHEMGTASLTLTSEKLAAGIYIYSIVADGKVIDSKRMIVADK